MKWIKDNGQEIETNDLKATIEGAVALGWKPADEVKKEESKKRGRPFKTEIE